uniref:Flavoprotein domain-containing protein n=1 Tax=Macrostomum lignano TaxID=282301 RepID=A0A1I8F6U0_9PLAT
LSRICCAAPGQPDGRRVTCGSSDRFVYVWDCASRQVVYKTAWPHRLVVSSTMSGAATKRKRRVLLGCTGSVASIKVPQMCQGLLDRGLDVAVVCTQSAEHFLARADRSMPEGVTRVCATATATSGPLGRRAATQPGAFTVRPAPTGRTLLAAGAPLWNANTLAKAVMVACAINLLNLHSHEPGPVGDFGRPIIFAHCSQ